MMYPLIGSNIGGGNKVDTGTFTRPKATRPQSNDTGQDRVKPPEDTDSVKHPNVSDIENLAKLQEESKILIQFTLQSALFYLFSLLSTVETQAGCSIDLQLSV